MFKEAGSMFFPGLRSMLIFHDPGFIGCVSAAPKNGGPEAWQDCRIAWCKDHVHDNHGSIDFCFGAPPAVGDDVEGVITGPQTTVIS